MTLCIIVALVGLVGAVYDGLPKWVQNMGMHMALGAVLAMALILVSP